MIKWMIKAVRQNRMPRQASESQGLMDDQGASDRKSDGAQGELSARTWARACEAWRIIPGLVSQ
jgi:hypothetical protein